jgi:hypothetical protein
MRDLGAAGGDSCSPRWSSDGRLWVAQAPAAQKVAWVEIDATSGARTGKSVTAPVSAGQNCAVPSTFVEPGSLQAQPLVTVISEETSDLATRPL